jgi:transposase
VVHVDETPVRHGKRKAWFHVCSTRSLTLLWASATRSRIAVDTGPLPTYTGTAVHDRYALYFQYGCAHALCNAHLIRNLAGVGMVHSQKPWTDAMIDLLTDTNNQVNTARAAGKTKLSTHHQRQITRRWNLRCAQALTANPDPPPRRTRNSYERDSHNLALALIEHRDRFLAFTTNFAIPFDNNQAERDLRMVKLQAKLSGEFRSLPGAQRFATIRSHISTTTKHRVSVLTNLARLYTTQGAWLTPTTMS